MEVPKSIITILNLLKSINNDKINKYLEIYNNTVKIKLDDSILCSIDSDSIILNEKIDVLKKIIIDNGKNKEIESKQIANFIKDISNSIIRLNHVGIAYFCKDIKDEINLYQKLFRNSNLKIYEEDSGNRLEKWLFIGNSNDWESPLFEVVLTESKGVFINEAFPHFQIDIDTNLSYEELKEMTAKFLDPKFIDWHLDFPDYGVVLAMGSLKTINGTKIKMRLGTNLRRTKYHRKNILKEIVPL